MYFPTPFLQLTMASIINGLRFMLSMLSCKLEFATMVRNLQFESSTVSIKIGGHIIVTIVSSVKEKKISLQDVPDILTLCQRSGNTCLCDFKLQQEIIANEPFYFSVSDQNSFKSYCPKETEMRLASKLKSRKLLENRYVESRETLKFTLDCVLHSALHFFSLEKDLGDSAVITMTQQ